MASVVFGFGSNVGNAVGSIQEAVWQLGDVVALTQVSSLYHSAPMYVVDQPAFVNAVGIGETDLGPRQLLTVLKGVEREMGRVARDRNGPREIDVDLLVYGAVSYRFVLNGDLQLQIPHPQLSERRFVLLPLFEIAPNLAIPGLGVVKDLLPLTESQAEDVTRIEDEVLSIHRTR